MYIKIPEKINVTITRKDNGAFVNVIMESFPEWYPIKHDARGYYFDTGLMKKYLTEYHQTKHIYTDNCQGLEYSYTDKDGNKHYITMYHYSGLNFIEFNPDKTAVKKFVKSYNQEV